MSLIQLQSRNLRLSSFLLSIGFFLLVSLTLGKSPIFTRGEGREAQVVQAMLSTENVILPLRNGSVVPSKPPLFHWMSLLSSKAIGEINEFTLRVPSCFAAALIIGTSYYYLSYFFSPIIAIVGVAIIGTNLEFLRYSTQARVDMVFSASFSLALFFLYEFIRSDCRVLYSFLSVLFLVFSVFSKGPFGMILPSVIVVAFLILTKRIKDFKLLIRLALVFLVATLFSAIWYYLAYLKLGADFLKVQLFKENIVRAMSSDPENIGHHKPIHFVGIYLIQVLVPWSIFIPRAIFGFSKEKFRELFKKNDFSLFNVIWFLTLAIAISVSGSKRSVYFLPAIIPIGLIFSLLIDFGRENRFLPWIEVLERTFLNILISISFLLFVFSFLLMILNLLSQDFVTNHISENNIPLEYLRCIGSMEALLFLFVALVLLVRARKTYIKSCFEKFVHEFSILIFGIFLVVQLYFAPKINMREDPSSFSSQVNEILGSKREFFQFENEYYAAVYYLNKQVPVISSYELRNIKGELFLLISKSDFEKMNKDNKTIELLLMSSAKLANRDDYLYLVKVIS